MHAGLWKDMAMQERQANRAHASGTVEPLHGYHLVMILGMGSRELRVALGAVPIPGALFA